jgi:hypothetical protein
MADTGTADIDWGAYRARGNPLTLITCAVCYCAVVERFWDKHIDKHIEKGEQPDGV